ncbi:hypothetical protein Q9L58_007041 [Maublancomyces gigas]|uniref:F-box domain-containing protein n=1 Tax=Discina gigas TaxID=1032678 RepID=A0ABR3GDT4_9PEZI
MSLVTIPTEVLSRIVTGLPRKDLAALVRTNRRLNTVLTFHLLRTAACWFGKRGATVLQWAVEKEHPSLIERLLITESCDITDSDDDERTALHHAAIGGKTEMVRLLLSKGANTLTRDLCAVGDSRTPLHHAAARGHLDIIRLLVGNGADINSPDAKGGTPLQAAAWNRCDEAVGLLLDLGASMKSPHGQSPLQIAAWNGSKEVARVAVEHGADIAEDNDGTALHRAAIKGHTAIAKLLLEKGAPLEAVDNEGATPLHRAVWNNHHILVTLIIESGANISVTDREGRTPLHWAASEGHKEAAAALLAKSADPNIQDKAGMVPLHHASVHNHISVVKLLLEHGADLKIEDNKSKTALDWAKQSKRKFVVELLEAGATPAAGKNVPSTQGTYPLDDVGNKHKLIPRKQRLPDCSSEILLRSLRSLISDRSRNMTHPRAFILSGAY